MKSFLLEIKESFRNAQGPFIMTIISFIIFLILTIDSLYYGYWNIFINLLFAEPFVVFLIFTLLGKKLKNRYYKIISNIISVLIIPEVVIYFFIVMVIEIFFVFQNPVTDIKYYENYYNAHSNLQKAFPEEIPKDVTNIHFEYSPGILQAGEEHSLYYIDNDINIEEFDDKYEEKSEWIGKIDDYDLKPGLLAGAFSFTPIELEEEDFTIYLIESETGDDGSTNHGYFLFVAINEKTKEVIYRSSDW